MNSYLWVALPLVASLLFLGCTASNKTMGSALVSGPSVTAPSYGPLYPSPLATPEHAATPRPSVRPTPYATQYVTPVGSSPVPSASPYATVTPYATVLPSVMPTVVPTRSGY